MGPWGNPATCLGALCLFRQGDTLRRVARHDREPTVFPICPRLFNSLLATGNKIPVNVALA